MEGNIKQQKARALSEKFRGFAGGRRQLDDSDDHASFAEIRFLFYFNL